MKIVFVETEDDEQPFFAQSLAGHEVCFVDTIEEVPLDAEIVSVFVNSRVGPGFLRGRDRPSPDRGRLREAEIWPVQQVSSCVR